MRHMNTSSCDGNSNSRICLRAKLSDLDFKSFQNLIWLWLGASGYQRIRTLNRTQRQGRGSVGPDFLVQVGEDGLEVAVQIRHWRSPMSKRAVDELRGVLLRDKIPAGMIVCPGKVSLAARTAAMNYSGRPIRIIGLESLADSLTALGLADPAFFRSIGAMSLGVPKLLLQKPARFSVDLASNPESGQPDEWPLIIGSVLLTLLILWLVKGLIG